MSTTPEQAEETTRDFITWVTERAVMQALEGYGHLTLRLKICVRAMPESDKFEVEVYYGPGANTRWPEPRRSPASKATSGRPSNSESWTSSSG